jgi:hypothetical protein
MKQTAQGGGFLNSKTRKAEQVDIPLALQTCILASDFGQDTCDPDPGSLEFSSFPPTNVQNCNFACGSVWV